ncbi:glycoside hydrolase family protein [Altererythrobacter soli]|uniref:Lysozyme n=1 Tax=Croceibacterium soli TaxID=1739690 RepID=A0A6I4UV48_9SPHN|nr:lysozyme [Croceibacterium soli]MXP41704.1 glycoside hydrolase family protein [Croceibacterium soli]
MRREIIFDRVRAMLGRGFRRDEIVSLDQAIQAALDGSAGQCPRQVGPAGVAMIKRFEGCAQARPDGRFEAYPDPGTGGVPWTIGWGATGPGIGPGTVWTQAECDARLEADIARHASEVLRALAGATATQGQFDALVSFHYNTGAIGRATLTRLHREGRHDAAAGEFARWNKAGGRVLHGLSRRRAAEAELYRNG